MAVDIIARGLAASAVRPDDNGKIPAEYLPSYVDDIIDLLAVSNSAPAHCSEGDKYYNTTTKLIYTATGTDTWGTTGEEPEKGKIYLDTSTNPASSYRWSGTEMVLVGQDLSDYVTFTDYATDSTGGVIKVSTQMGAELSNGVLNPLVRTYEQYQALTNNYYFISKGTLENVITGKNLETANNKVTSIDENSTDTQYPSAKCVYNLVGDIQALLDNLDVGRGVQ